MILDYYFLMLESSKFYVTDSFIKNLFFFQIYIKHIGPLYFLLDVIIRNDNKNKENLTVWTEEYMIEK